MKTPIARRTLLATLVSLSTLAAVIPATVHAFDKASPSALNVDAKNLAVKGYDVVAYFTLAAPTEGKAQFAASHQGATYWFANEVNRDAFKGNPERYAPQFGGFCAMGVALDQKFDGDPHAWRIENDKLYLNLNKDIQSKWLKDVPGHLRKANDIWPKIRDKAPKDL